MLPMIDWKSKLQKRVRNAMRMDVPFDQWPAWGKKAYELRTPEDRGVGDVVARMIPFGDQFKATFKKVFGVDCGCDACQESLNVRYPFSKNPCQRQ